jgi:hypothetical protein
LFPKTLSISSRCSAVNNRNVSFRDAKYNRHVSSNSSARSTASLIFRPNATNPWFRNNKQFDRAAASPITVAKFSDPGLQYGTTASGATRIR